MQLSILVAEILGLYLLSRRLTQILYDLVYLVTRARTVAITFVTILAFPGTVIHELAHLFTAEVLGVRTGKLTLVPENLQEEDVKAGSVMIANTDPFRRFAIGLAPVFVGLLAIATLSYLLSLSTIYDLRSILYYYLLFAVSNSMFSSREDLKGFIPFVAALSLLVAAAYAMGFRIGLTGPVLTISLRILSALVQNLGVVLLINLVGFITVTLLLVIIQTLTHRKLSLPF